MRIWKLALAFALLSGCGATLTKEIIKNHPAVSLKILKPEVVESSAPIEPAWVRKETKSAGDAVPFTGQSFARTLDEAKKQADRDLLSAVSNYIAVEVEAEFESTETHDSKDGDTHESQAARNVVRTHSASALRELKPDGAYWEKIVASPLTPENVSYRYFVHATVPRTEILRARLKKQLARNQTNGKKTVVFLPFFPALDDRAKSDVLANAFLDEISHRLSDDANLQISDPALVLSLLSDGSRSSDTERIEAVQDALLPDLVVRGAYQRHETRLKVSYVVYDTKEARSVKTQSLEAAYDKLFELEDRLADVLRKDLDEAAAKTTPHDTKSTHGRTDKTPPAKVIEAFEAYHEAYARFRAGDNEGALKLLHRAIELRPDYAEAYARMGHVLERMGRYARIIQTNRRTRFRERADAVSEIACLGETEMAAARFHGPSREHDPKDWAPNENALEIDVILRDVQAGGIPLSNVPEPLSTAAEAYDRAIQIARKTGDWRLDAEVSLALADLAVRVDRTSEAFAIYQALITYATRSTDLNLKSLAEFGQGVALHQSGKPWDAIPRLREALYDRIVLGEKPYLVEIYNELGAIAVDIGDYPGAHAMYWKARRIAKDLGNDYIAAVLSNNLGVLDFALGRISVASDEFERAYDYLHQIDEAEGQISSGLNAGHVGALKGDFDRTKEMMDEVGRLIERTGQEKRRAEMLDHRGFAAALQGRDPIADLVESWSIYRDLRLAKHEMRLRNNIAAAEYARALEHDVAQPDETRVTLACLRLRLDGLSNPYEQGRPRWQQWLASPSERDLGSLMIRLNAAALGALRR